ncbi:MAG: hypothetical protein P4L57_11110 [Rhizomicrobium sp.]|nr:hypothetical protein [Rhizomicrobium sp.]
MVSARKAVAGVLGVALILVGVSFLGFGLATALAPALSLAGGAAATGLLLLLPPLLWALAKAPAPEEPQPAAHGVETLWLSELTRLAVKKPLLAVLLAIGAGAVQSFWRKR